MASGSRHHILKRTIAATAWPVSVDDVKADLRLEHDDDDGLIQGLIQAATELAGAPNGITGKALATETWALSIRAAGRDSCIHLPVTPVKSLSSITYYDGENQAQSLDVADFYLYGDENWAYVQPKTGVVWPSLYDRLDAITVTFVAGFESVPKNIQQGMRLMVSHWYENRLAVVTGTIATELPMAAEMLLGMSRKGWVA